MSWFILSILSVFALATAELSQQNLLNSKNSFTPRASLVLTYASLAILTFILILILGISSQIFVIFRSDLLIRTVSVSIIGALATSFYFKSFQVKNISLSAILISSSAIISTILGIIFFSESIEIIKFIGISLIFASLIIVNYSNPQLEKNHLYGLIAGILFGVVFILDKSVVLEIHPIIYLFWVVLFASLLGFVQQSKNVLASLSGKSFSSYKLILFSCIGYFLYNFFTFTSYNLGGEVGKIDAINNSQIFIIILFEYFVLKQTEGIRRKFLAAIIAIVGITILGMY